MTVETLGAAAAESGQAGDDVIAGTHRRDVGAHRLDDARALVAEHDRTIEREPPDAVDDVQIAVAHTRRRGPHQHLAAPRLVDVDGFDGQRLLHLAKHRRLHLHSPLLDGVRL